MNPSRTETPEFVPTAFLPDPYAGINKDPALRWRRVEYLLAHRRWPFYGRDDRVTWLAWRYLRLWRRCHTDAGREHLAQHFPAIAEAHSVFTSDEPFKRWELEARILGRQTDQEIADRLNLSAAGVAAYAQLFFDVRDCLEADFYIVNTVIGPKVHYGLQADDRDVLLKIYGYFWGGVAVNVLLDYFRRPPVVPASLDGLDLAALKDLRRRLSTHRCILGLTTPLSELPPASRLSLALQPPPADHADDTAREVGAIQHIVDTINLISAGVAATRQRPPEEGPVAA